MLVQLDGSHHAWLEGRGPKLVLLLAVDDATSAVVNAVFRTGEDKDTAGYFTLQQGLIERRGIPLALYSDRHAARRQSWKQIINLSDFLMFTGPSREPWHDHAKQN